MVLRKIVLIDEDRCTGCGRCITRCAEGALRMTNRKAKLVSDVYCDGLGACLGECPAGAITIEEKEVQPFNEEAARRRTGAGEESHNHEETMDNFGSCPSVMTGVLRPATTKKTPEPSVSKLSNWPIQLSLVQPKAPFLEGADLVIAADCVPFAYANFHSDFLEGKRILVGCPRLDDLQSYKQRLTEIFVLNEIRGLTVANMEVPCCFGLLHAVKQAISSSGKNIPLSQETISVRGKRVTQPIHIAPK